MRVLVINAGSSSIKYQVISLPEGESQVQGLIENIGTGGPSTHTEALHLLVEQIGDVSGIDAVGHRVVHGGSRFVEPTLITPEVETHIEELSSLAPLHNPANLAGIQAAKDAVPGVPQVAVFDTAFHQTMPDAASTIALPTEVASTWGIRKYGFHGTSHQYVSRIASTLLGGDSSTHKIITAHLGNGSSMAAIKGGRCIDTSMGFTPLQGLVMGTRPGDTDVAVVSHLLRNAGLSLDQVDTMLNTESGLLGIAGSSDFRDITSRAEAGDEVALRALDVWAWRIRHYIGAYAALLGGLDALVFTGGIGENSVLGRREATAGLEFLGVALDPYLNERRSSSARYVSPSGASVAVMVIPTNEELEIATQVAAIVGQAR